MWSVACRRLFVVVLWCVCVWPCISLLVRLFLGLVEKKIVILPAVSDHNMVLAEFCFGATEAEYVSRTVFDYSKAPWAKIRHDLALFAWRPMDVLGVDDAERFLHENIPRMLERHIPQHELRIRNALHH